MDGYSISQIIAGVVIAGAGLGAVGKWKFQTKTRCESSRNICQMSMKKDIEEIKKITDRADMIRQQQIEKRDKLDKELFEFMGEVKQFIKIANRQ